MIPEYYSGFNHRILERVPQSAIRILDVGCARGVLGQALKGENSAREVWGIEAIKDVGNEAKLRLDHVLIGNAEAMDPLPLPSQYFDCAIFGDVLEHFREPGAFLSRLRPHLHKDSTVLVNIPNVAHWMVLVELLQGKFDYQDNGPLDRTHLRFFTPSSFRRLLWESGFQILTQEPHEIPHEVCGVFAQAAQAMGIDPSVTTRSCTTYSELFTARLKPAPLEEPEKLAGLLGPHMGKLGEASLRASVVVLTYNSVSTLDQCVASVLKTIGPEDELIIVDNASTDGTQDLMKSWAAKDDRVRIILNDRNLGFAAGCNVGLLAAKGEFLILLNPDTEVYDGLMEGIIGRLQDPGIGAVGPLGDNVGGQQFVGHHLPPDDQPSIEALPFVVQDLNAGTSSVTKLLIGFCIGFRRETLNKVGLLDDHLFLGADDLEMSWRLRELGYQLAIARDVFVSHKQGASFESIGDKKQQLVRESDNALIRKLEQYYGPSVPNSMELFDSNIFDEALAEWKAVHGLRV